ncbi:hypothetical protein ACFE04_023004 [Oxalis oulophora]
MTDSVKFDSGARKLGYYVANREWIGRLFSKLGKFAVDSSVNNYNSLPKGSIIGNKKVVVHEIVQQELKLQPKTPCLNVDCTRDNEQRLTQKKKKEADLKENLEEMNVVKPRIGTASGIGGMLEPLEKMPNEGFGKSNHSLTNGRKIFIRSRL